MPKRIDLKVTEEELDMLSSGLNNTCYNLLNLPLHQPRTPEEAERQFAYLAKVHKLNKRVMRLKKKVLRGW